MGNLFLHLQILNFLALSKEVNQPSLKKSCLYFFLRNPNKNYLDTNNHIIYSLFKTLYSRKIPFCSGCHFEFNKK